MKCALTGANALFAERNASRGSVVFRSNMTEHAELSNLFVLDPPMMTDLITPGVNLPYHSVEHYYQAAKAVHLGLPALARLIQLSSEPKTAKKLGGKAAMISFVLDLENWSNPLQVDGAFCASLGLSRQVRPSKEALKKHLAGALKSFDRTSVMRAALRLKFDSNRDPKVVKTLVNTGRAALGESRSRGKNIWAISEHGDNGLLGELLEERRAALST